MCKFYSGLLLALLVLGSGMPVHAATSSQTPSSLHLVTNPLPVSVDIPAGTKKEIVLKVKNAGENPEKLQVTLMYFTALGEDGKPLLHEFGEDDFTTSWVSFSPSSFDIAPGEWKDVAVTIDLPTSAGFSYYFAVVFSRYQDVNTPVEPGQNKLLGGIASLILVDTKRTDAVRELALDSFSIGKSVVEYLPAKFNLRLKNVGNVHVAPHGNIFIKRGTKQVALIEINPESGSVLPESRRIFVTSWNDGFPLRKQVVENGAVTRDADGDVVEKIEWNLADAANFRFGRYTADLVMTYDNGLKDVVTERSVTFWVLPWKLMTIAVLILALSLFGLISLLRAIVRRLRKKKNTPL